MRRLARWLALLLAVAAPAAAVLVDTSDPELYERPPSDDPGWRNVGRRGITSAVYLGDGWVITSRHSAMGEVELDGESYRPLTRTLHWLDSPMGGIKADLIMFRITPEPSLPKLRLRQRPIDPGTPVTLVGYGQGRGGPAIGGPGFRLDGRPAKRWGTNSVEPGRLNFRGPNDTLTQCFWMRFSRGESPHEAQATVGDSGGAVFERDGDRWRLAGVLIAVGSSPSQRRNEALFGNSTQAADIGAYVSQILAILDGSPSRKDR